MTLAHHTVFKEVYVMRIVLVMRLHWSARAFACQRPVCTEYVNI